MFYMIILSFMLVLLIYLLFSFLFLKMKSMMEKASSYECGFDPYSLTRITFSYRFYLISILFIIFDVEISLMLPIPFITVMNGMGSMILCFIFILLVGLLYEYNYGSLDWLNFLIKT